MPEASTAPGRAGAAETFEAVGRALSRAGEALPESPGRIRNASGRVRRAPPSIGRVGAFSSGPTTWVWCEPAPGAVPAPGGQLVLDLPPGRYLCDVLDVAEARWCSRESAGGGPLVVGLSALAGEAVVRIGRVLRER